MTEVIDRVMESEGVERDGTITLSTGVVVRAKRVPDNLVLALHRQNPAPRPPIVTIEEEGRRPRREENPNDPDYIQATEAYQIEMAGRMTDLIHLTGMEIIELPEDMKDFEDDDEWADDLEAVGIDVPTGRASRKLLWIRYRVAPTSDDLTAISTAYNRSIGEVDETEVAIIEEQFPGDAGRVPGEGLEEQ